MPHLFTMSTRNADALVLALRRAHEAHRETARQVVGEAAERVHQRAYDLAPKDTGFMADQIKSRVSRGGYVYEVGLDEEDFAAAGFEFYAVFQEFGTVNMPAQPFLFPAAEETRDWYEREMTRRQRATARRLARTRGRAA